MPGRTDVVDIPMGLDLDDDGEDLWPEDKEPRKGTRNNNAGETYPGDFREEGTTYPDDYRSDLFDYSAGYDDDTGVALADGLSRKEREEATLLYRLFTPLGEAIGLWGLCLVVGDPGNGKDTFGNIATYKLKKFFRQKRILRDEKPRPLFGVYAGIFNDYVIQEDLSKMRDLAKHGRVDADGAKFDGNYMNALEKAADDWVTEKGEVLLKHSVVYLTEFWRYCYKREPHNPMNKTMGGIHKVKRHLDTLIIGNTQQVEDLDRFTCLPWVDWRVTCVKSVANRTGFVYYVDRVKYDKRAQVLVSPGRPFPIAWDAGKPRSDLGDGKIVVRKPEYRPVSEEEQIVLNVLRAGADKYEDVVDFITENGDMTESEVLDTIKELRMGTDLRGKFKRVIGYPCYFDLFNSKSAPQMKSSLKVAD